MQDRFILLWLLLSWLQVCTQRSWKRPYGVGLLVAGLDESGAHLYYNCPSGNYFEYQAFAIGSRSQAAKTYMERRFEGFVSSTREDLLKDALFALRETLQGEKLKSSICTVAVVGVVEEFHILDNETVQGLIDAFEIVGEETPATEEAAPAADEPAAPDQGAPADEGVAPMDIWETVFNTFAKWGNGMWNGAMNDIISCWIFLFVMEFVFLIF